VIVVRDAILTATIVALIFLAAHRPPIVKDNQTPYCQVDVLQSMRHPFTGEKVSAWGPMYRPCGEQDIYREI